MKIGIEEQYESSAGARWSRTSKVPMRDTNGKIIGIVGFAEDITERKQAENVLHQYKHIVSSSTDMLALLDKQYTYLAANKAYCDAFNLISEELIGNTVTNVFGEEFFNTVIKPNANRCMRGEEVNYRNWFDFPAYKRRYMDITYYPYYNEDYKIMGFVVNGRNITVRRQAEEALLKSEEKMSSIFRVAPTGIGVVKDRVIIEVNPRICEITGYSKNELLGKNARVLYPTKEEYENVGTEIYRQIAESGTGTVETRWLKKNGSILNILLSSTPINIDNYSTGITFTALDITERKQAKKELTKLSTAVKQSPSVILITNTKGDLEYVNPKFTELTGYTFEEAKGQNPRFLKSVELTDEMYKELWKTISSGKEWRGEFHNKKKNGELFWESASISPIFDGHGKIINYVKVAEDITERKRIEQIQKIIHNISNATNTSLNIDEFIKFIKEELGTIIDTKNFYVTLYDDKTKTVSLLYHHDQKDKLEKFPQGKTLTNYVIKTKKPLLATKEVKDKLIKSGEIELLGKDSKIWLGVPLLIKEKVIGAFAMQSYTDAKAFDKADMRVLEIISNQISISLERKKAEEDLKLALEKAQESDRLKSAFLSNMSHEIRTPMNGILGFTSLLKQPHLTGEEQSNYIEIIERSGNRMLNTVNDIIDISMIEAGQVKVVKTEVSVNKILNEQYAFFNTEAQSKGLVLIYKPTLSDKEATIVTDKHKLEGILINLIKNAIKFTKHGNISFGYSLIKEKDIKELKFYVKDTGIGIPSDRIKAVFNRFEKADIEDTQVFEGSGLGLAISKSYVEMLGGNIQLSSKEGSGSTFTFTIPYVQQSTKYSGVENIEKEEQKSSLSDVSIIIAEDDETSQLFFKTIFKNKFRNIICTTNGAEAIEAIKKHPETDIILMDLKMPGMNGYDATREIRKFNRDVIIIAQTAFGLSGDKEKALEAGCDDYITKPINEELSAQKFCKNLCDRAGILAELGDSDYIFRHKSFREYLTGLHIIKKAGDAEFLRELVGHFGDDWWEEPLRFFMGEAGIPMCCLSNKVNSRGSVFISVRGASVRYLIMPILWISLFTGTLRDFFSISGSGFLPFSGFTPCEIRNCFISIIVLMGESITGQEKYSHNPHWQQLNTSITTSVSVNL